MKKKLLAALAGGLLITSLTACSDDADVVNKNLSKAADNFEVNRRVVFFNGITDKYLLSVEGLCAVEPKGGRLWVTCKVAKGDGAGAYKRHSIGLSDNVSYFVEQLDAVETSAYHYRVTFKPQEILPDLDFRGSTSDGPQKQG